MKEVALLILILLALISLQTMKLRNAIIYLGVFSMTLAFVYLLYGAPDVAIAEAVIGSTMATVLYIVAFQKYRLFVIYIHVPEVYIDDTIYKNNHYGTFIHYIEKYTAKNGLEPMIIYTVSTVNHIKENHRFGVIIESFQEEIHLHVHKANIKANAIINASSEAYMTENTLRKVVIL
ncbi:MAG: DUF4040 domain-containing protein [Clostridia bacterium]|nr:DUF4040 domain-containing protein [Clostridia bacterium]